MIRTRRKSHIRKQNVPKCRTPPLRFLRFSRLGEHGAALVGLPDLLEEHEILQGDDRSVSGGERRSRRAADGRRRSLTMRKQAPSRTAFIFTSMSSGNWMPKLSVSVKTSFRRPLHCLLMRPMGLSLSLPLSCRTTSSWKPLVGDSWAGRRRRSPQS